VPFHGASIARPIPESRACAVTDITSSPLETVENRPQRPVSGGGVFLAAMLALPMPQTAPWKRTASAVRKESREEAALAAVDNFAERTFFVTSVTWGRRPLFQSEPAARLFLECLFGYRERGILQLYEFVLMPDHIHLLLAPQTDVALERAMQFIKGGYSHRFTKETGSKLEIWQRSFTNHRVRDWADFEKHRRYIHLNPVRAGLVEFPKDYPYSSAHQGFSVDAAPRRLKPVA
jgi:putative transposase